MQNAGFIGSNSSDNNSLNLYSKIVIDDIKIKG